jgi:hypothetical protein
MMPHLTRRGRPSTGRTAARHMGQADYGFPQTARLAIAFSSEVDTAREENASRISMQRSAAGIAWPSLKISTEKNF